MRAEKRRNQMGNTYELRFVPFINVHRKIAYILVVDDLLVTSVLPQPMLTLRLVYTSKVDSFSDTTIVRFHTEFKYIQYILFQFI